MKQETPKRKARSARLVDSTHLRVSVQYEEKRFDGDIDPQDVHNDPPESEDGYDDDAVILSEAIDKCQEQMVIDRKKQSCQMKGFTLHLLDCATDSFDGHSYVAQCLFDVASWPYKSKAQEPDDESSQNCEQEYG